jgi:hypothetical protein
MKNLIKKTIAMAALVIAAGAYSACFGQITGGYGDADTGSKEVRSAAAFAVKQLGTEEAAKVTLVKTEKARVQVVAGLNYELCMEVKVVRRSKSATRYVKAIVYRDLKNKYKLTNWSLSTDPPTCGDGQ